MLISLTGKYFEANPGQNPVDHLKACISQAEEVLCSNDQASSINYAGDVEVTIPVTTTRRRRLTALIRISQEWQRRPTKNSCSGRSDAIIIKIRQGGGGNQARLHEGDMISLAKRTSTRISLKVSDTSTIASQSTIAGIPTLAASVCRNMIGANFILNYNFGTHLPISVHPELPNKNLALGSADIPKEYTPIITGMIDPCAAINTARLRWILPIIQHCPRIVRAIIYCKDGRHSPLILYGVVGYETVLEKLSTKLPVIIELFNPIHLKTMDPVRMW